MAANAQTTSYYVRTVYETVDKSSTSLAAIATSADKAGTSLKGATESVMAFNKAADAMVRLKTTLDGMNKGPLPELNTHVTKTSTHMTNVSRGTDTVTSSVKRATMQFFTFNQAVDALSRLKSGFDTLVKGPLLDFNAGLEQSRIQIAGMMQLNIGGDFTKNFRVANSLVEEFQQIAKASVGTTKDFVDMAANLTRPILAAGGSMRDLRDFTKSAVILSRAFGVNADVAAFDIEQALTGTMTKRDRLTRALLTPLGFDTEAFNKLSAKQRMDVLSSAMTQPAIQDMAKAQEQSFSGVVSTMQDNLQMAIGKIGLPLFQKITAEVQRWNTWIDANGETITKFADKLSEALVDAFSFIKDVGSFFVENADTLMAVAKGLIAFKAGQMVMGAGRAAIGGMRSAGGFLMGTQSMTQLAGTTSVATSTVGAFAGALGRALPVIGGLVTAGTTLFELWRNQSDEQKAANQKFMFEAKRSVDNVARIDKMKTSLADVRSRFRSDIVGGGLSTQDRSQMQFAQKRLALLNDAQRQFDQQLAQLLFDQGVFNKKFEVDNNALQKDLRDKALNIQEDQLDTFTKAVTSLENRLGPAGIRELLLPDGVPEEDRTAEQLAQWNDTVDKLTNMAKSGTKVTINKVEVASPDPDRFIHGIARAAERFNRNPTQAQAALRGGL